MCLANKKTKKQGHVVHVVKGASVFTSAREAVGSKWRSRSGLLGRSAVFDSHSAHTP